jgi:hypothetical protein
MLIWDKIMFLDNLEALAGKFIRLYDLHYRPNYH